MSVFLGWKPDAAAQAVLAKLQEGIREVLPADAPRHDWRKPAQWHMTLRYLGEGISAEQRARIETAMADVTASTDAAGAVLADAQYWPHARVLVAKIDASDALKSLLKRIEASVQACGFPKERAQTAHITLAYLPRGSQVPVLPAPAIPATPLRIDQVVLLQTVPGGYMSLAAWPFAPGTTPA